MSTERSREICGVTGSTARTNRLLAKIARLTIPRTRSGEGGRPDADGDRPVSEAVMVSSQMLVESAAGLRNPVEILQPAQKRFEIPQRHHVGPVGRRLIWVLVGLD